MSRSYEYCLIDSYKRSDGTPTNFKYELNKRIKNINSVELVHASFNNTIHNFTRDNNKFYFQEEGGNYTILNTNISYQVKDVLNLSEVKEIKFKLRFRTIDSDDVENYTYEPQTGDYYYHVEIANNADWTIQTMIQYLQTEFRKIPGIANFTVKQFGGSLSWNPIPN